MGLTHRQRFDRCLSEVLRHEGAYVDHPADPGGATNLGITLATLRAWRKRPVSKADVRDLTRAEAAEIYRARYWDAVRGDDLPAGVDLMVFDLAVNSGVKRGGQFLQEALGVAADGAIGPVTLAALKAVRPVEIIERMAARRERYYRGLRTFPTFGKGWLARLASVRARALEGAR